MFLICIFIGLKMQIIPKNAHMKVLWITVISEHFESTFFLLFLLLFQSLFPPLLYFARVLAHIYCMYVVVREFPRT